MAYLDKVRLNDGAIVLGKRNKTWHMQIKVGTKYIRETCGTPDLEIAKSIAYSKFDDLRLVMALLKSLQKFLHFLLIGKNISKVNLQIKNIDNTKTHLQNIFYFNLDLNN